MGWGEPIRIHVDVPPAVLEAARNMANRVREWNEHRSTANEERLVGALVQWDQAMEQPW